MTLEYPALSDEVIKRFSVKNKTDEAIVKKFKVETKTKGNTEVVTEQALVNAQKDSSVARGDNCTRVPTSTCQYPSHNPL